MTKQNFFVMIALVIGAVFCWQAAQSQPKSDEDAELYRLFVDSLENIDRNYVKKVKRRELIESAINGMLSRLDEHSNFIPPTNLNMFERQTKGSFGGIGIRLETDNPKEKFPMITEVLYGTPAYEAGIIATDRVLAVNGQSLEGKKSEDIFPLLSGEADTSLKLTMLRKPYESNKPKEVTLKRAVIHIPNVLGDSHNPDDSWNFMIDETNKIGYIRLAGFVLDSADEFERALKTLLKKDLQGLIIDVRYNPGGILDQAVKICDLFLEKGVIVSTAGRAVKSQRYEASSSNPLPKFPIVVMVNRFSASASEIVAACLQDHKRAIVVGERSFGKGSVQNVIELEDGKSALKLTTASYMRPSGANIHRFKENKDSDPWGVMPDAGFEIKFTDEDHGRYFEQRRLRDRLLGKHYIVEEAMKTNPELKTANQPKTDFKDKQLEKSLEYLRKQIAEKKPEKKAA